MVQCEDEECSICHMPYSHMDRIPRVLNCRHTFCEPCLETMSQARSGLLTLGCPLCRQVTCIGCGLSLQEALWVNSRLWEWIPEEEEGVLKQEAKVERMETKQQAEFISSSSTRTKLKLPAFFRRFSLTKQHQERIVPDTNVEMKSRLSIEERI